MQVDDLGGVVAVAASAFPDHFEARVCFEERFALFPQGCFVLATKDVVTGYLIAYPLPIGTIPPLNTLLGSLPQSCSAVYLHDLALHPAARGQGFAGPIVESLVATARSWGTQKVHLVAVNNSVPFWRTLGFEPAVGDVPDLGSYSAASDYMMRDI